MGAIMRKAAILLFLKLNFSLFTAMVLIYPLTAQESIIKGQVTDQDNKPLANVQITFHDLARGTRFSVTTKKDGTYFKVGLPPATYKITVKAEGFFPFETTLQIEFGREHTANFILERITSPIEEDIDFKEGLKYFEAGELEAAAASFQKAAEKMPHSLEANYNLAICYLRLEKTAEAIDLLERILRQKKDVPEVYMALGEAYFNRQEIDKAISNFKRAQELQPNNERILYDLGLIYYKIDQLESAISSLEQAIKLNPHFSSAYYQLGLVFIKKGDYSRAIEALEKFLQLEPEAKEASQVKVIIDELKKK